MLSLCFHVQYFLHFLFWNHPAGKRELAALRLWHSICHVSVIVIWLFPCGLLVGL